MNSLLPKSLLSVFRIDKPKESKKSKVHPEDEVAKGSVRLHPKTPGTVYPVRKEFADEVNKKLYDEINTDYLRIKSLEKQISQLEDDLTKKIHEYEKEKKHHEELEKMTSQDNIKEKINKLRKTFMNEKAELRKKIKELKEKVEYFEQTYEELEQKLRDKLLGGKSRRIRTVKRRKRSKRHTSKSK